jgi:predicted HicB family RNase H-like nuclease
MAVRIPRDLHRRLRLYTTQQETTIKDFTREAIIEKMAGDLK